MSTATNAWLVSAADELWGAERERMPVDPLTDRIADLTVADAYAIQRHNVERKVEAGDTIVGRKIGLTSHAMQRQLGVGEPDYGALLASMRVHDGDVIAIDDLIAPRIEAEIAFVMGQDLRGPGVDALAAVRATVGVVPAIEVIDSRIADWRIALQDTIADNASSARFVLGDRLTPLDGLDLRLLGVVVTRAGEVVQTGAGAAALGNPLRCVAWLANKLAEFDDALRADDIVLAGALHAAVTVDDGDTFNARFAHLGSVGVRFAGSEEEVS
jgi:2-oxopent-4-enoate hydratase